MPSYTCEKCAKVFKQKSGYTDHLSKKNDCSKTTAINTIVESAVKTSVKEVVRSLTTMTEITKDNLQAFYEDLHNLLWNKAGLSPERALEHLTFFFAYRLIETQADTLNLPQECRWSFLASMKNENDTYETMKKGCVAFQKNKVTKPFFKKPEIEKADIIYDVIQQINRISLKTLQETDTLGDIFEYMLGRGMSTMSDEGQYFTNRIICKLAFKLAYKVKKNLRRPDGSLCTFADWFCGTGGFPAEYVRGIKQNLADVNWEKDSASIYCQDMNLSSVTTTLLNMLILTGIPFSSDRIRSGNSFSDAITIGETAPLKGKTIDYCFLNPPYGGDKTKGKEYKFAYSKGKGNTKKYLVNQEIQSIGIEDDEKYSAGVQLAMSTLSADGGVCSVVLPQGFFFGATNKKVELRKKIVEEYKIHYVVDIASGSFLNTTTKTSMIVFQKGVGPTEKVSFIGLNETPLIETTLEELRAKNYSLNFKQYLPQSEVEVDGFEMMKLGDIAKKLSTRGKHSAKDTVENGKYSLFSSSINEIYALNTFDYPETCCIINSTNASGNAIVHLGKNFSVTSDTFVFKCENDITTTYIQLYLSSNINLVKETFQGANHKHPTWERLSDIQIPIPSLERQQEIVDSIDGFTQLAHAEEQSLKMLEKQVMFEVKEMGHGQERVKLGKVIKKVKSGKTNSTSASGTGEYPFYGCTAIVPTNTHNSFDFEGEEYLLFAKSGGNAKTKVGENLGIGKFHYVTGKTAGNIAVFQYIVDTELATCQFIYYLLRTKLEEIQLLADYTTGNGNINLELMYNSIELQLPPLTEQQTLQSDFDEIHHKHAKIATYKAKAQAAIQRLIPGAENKKINEIVIPKTDSVSETTSVSSEKPKRKRPQVASE